MSKSNIVITPLRKQIEELNKTIRRIQGDIGSRIIETETHLEKAYEDLDAAHELIEELHESGCLDEERIDMIDKYLDGLDK